MTAGKELAVRKALGTVVITAVSEKCLLFSMLVDGLE